MTSFSKADIERARGIVNSVPDLDRGEFVSRRRRAVGVFTAWLLATGLVAILISPVMIVPGVVVGWFVLDAAAITTRGRAKRDLEWAHSVLNSSDAENDLESRPL